MSLLNEIKCYCLDLKIKPLRRRGQNFLINPLIYQRIVETANLQSQDIAVEIGPGFGHLIERLADRAKKIIAIEIDKNLERFLTKKFLFQKKIKIIQEDALRFNPEDHGLNKYKIVANIPYNITGAILKKFLTNSIQPQSMILMVQKEIAERLISRPPRMSLLAVTTQFYGQVKVSSYVSKNNFWPKPKVDSAIIKIDNIGRRRNIDEEKFFNLVRLGFFSPRKYLINNLLRDKNISRVSLEKFFTQDFGLHFRVRPQELSLDQWIKLYHHLYLL